MSKRTTFTTVTPLPAGISRKTVLDTLHDHFAMIDLNPLVTERHPIKPPREASPEEFHCKWYAVTDKVNYLPGGLYSGSVTFNGCFNDLPDGLQTHIYAPMGLNMKGRWTLGGTLPGEPIQPVEIGLGIPKSGLWLKETVDMKCNFAMTKFVKSTTKKTHATLVKRLVEKAHIDEAQMYNSELAQQLNLRDQYPPDYHSEVASPGASSTYPPGGKHLYTAPTSPPLRSPYSDRQSYSSQASGYAGENQSYIKAAYPDPRADPRNYISPLNPQRHPSYQDGAPYAPSLPQFAVELPSHEEKQPMELYGSQR